MNCGARLWPRYTLMPPIDTPFGKLGLGICYDLRFPELARVAALEGCDLPAFPSAWVDDPGKVDQWKTLLAARAIENELFVIGVSRPDRGFGTDVRDYAGHSCAFGPRTTPSVIVEGATRLPGRGSEAARRVDAPASYGALARRQCHDRP